MRTSDIDLDLAYRSLMENPLTLKHIQEDLGLKIDEKSKDKDIAFDKLSMDSEVYKRLPKALRKHGVEFPSHMKNSRFDLDNTAINDLDGIAAATQQLQEKKIPVDIYDVKKIHG